jgi:hypothetical protein
VGQAEGEGVEVGAVEEVAGAVQLDDEDLVGSPLGVPQRPGDEVGLDAVDAPGDLDDVDGPPSLGLGPSRRRTEERQEGAEDQEEAG